MFLFFSDLGFIFFLAPSHRRPVPEGSFNEWQTEELGSYKEPELGFGHQSTTTTTTTSLSPKHSSGVISRTLLWRWLRENEGFRLKIEIASPVNLLEISLLKVNRHVLH